MASQGPNFPTVATGNTSTVGGGTVAWTSPGNITANDGTSATCLPGVATTDDLVGTGFGFSIPTGATINGILLEISVGCTTTNVGALNNVFLLKVGAAVGTNHGSTVGSLQPTLTLTSLGGSTDLWGTTWTPADINASNFGAVITEKSAGGGPGTIAVDFFRITVFYTPANTGTTAKFFQMF